MMIGSLISNYGLNSPGQKRGNILPTEKGVSEKVGLIMQNEGIRIKDENAVEQIFTILDVI